MDLMDINELINSDRFLVNSKRSLFNRTRGLLERQKGRGFMVNTRFTCWLAHLLVYWGEEEKYF